MFLDEGVGGNLVPQLVPPIVARRLSGLVTPQAAEGGRFPIFGTFYGGTQARVRVVQLCEQRRSGKDPKIVAGGWGEARLPTHPTVVGASSAGGESRARVRLSTSRSRRVGPGPELGGSATRRADR